MNRPNTMSEFITGGIGRVLLDWQLCLVIQDLVEHVRRVAHGARNDLGAVRRVLVRRPGVVRDPAAEAEVARQGSGVAGFDGDWEALTVRRRERATAPELG